MKILMSESSLIKFIQNKALNMLPYKHTIAGVDNEGQMPKGFNVLHSREQIKVWALPIIFYFPDNANRTLQ